MLRGFRFLVILLVLAGLALLSAITTMHFAIHGAEVRIPSFKGLTVSQATEKALSMGLDIGVESRYYSVDIPEGHIVGQSPAPGAVVRRNWHVRLIESLGPQRVAIPNVTDLDQRVASIQIRRDSLELGTTASIPWSYAPIGSVIAQSPAPGAAGVARPTVSLLLAAPPANSSPAFVMPDLTGQSIYVATQDLTQAGLKLGAVVTVPTAPSPASSPAVTPGANTAPSANATQPAPPPTPSGTILSQSPAPGQRIDATTAIQLTVAE